MGLQYSRLRDLDVDSQAYTLQAVSAPRLTGFLLRAFARLVRGIFGGPVVAKLKDDNNFRVVRELAAVVDDQPLYYPLHVPSADELHRHAELAKAAPAIKAGRSAEFTAAYASKRATPSAVVEAVLKACAEAKDLHAVLQQLPDQMRLDAGASTERYEAGKPLGPLDGVPVFVKEEMAVKGCKLTQGTSFLTAIAEEDSEPVKRLRAAGAIICGTTNMHEIGIGTTGHNNTFGAILNPWDPQRYPGGSSSGSGAAVAAGLAPISLGADGGGSIRIPASLCGVAGLKPSFARLPCENHLDWSVGVVGPIAATADDVAAAYLAMAGPGAAVTPYSLHQPPPHVSGFDRTENLSDLRIGVFRPYFEDCDPGVRQGCERALEALQGRGAKVVDVAICHLEAIMKAHACTILSEFATSMDRNWQDHVSEFAPETAISLALARSLSAVDLLAAQRVRAYATRQVKGIFKDVDLIAMPATASTAPRRLPDAERCGESNLAVTAKLLRFSFLANLVGLPAGVVPVGLDDGLPVGFQVMGDHWNEHLVLRAMKAVEEASGPLPRPQRWWDLLA